MNFFQLNLSIIIMNMILITNNNIECQQQQQQKHRRLPHQKQQQQEEEYFHQRASLQLRKKQLKQNLLYLNNIDNNNNNNKITKIPKPITLSYKNIIRNLANDPSSLTNIKPNLNYNDTDPSDNESELESIYDFMKENPKTFWIFVILIIMVIFLFGYAIGGCFKTKNVINH